MTNQSVLTSRGFKLSLVALSFIILTPIAIKQTSPSYQLAECNQRYLEGSRPVEAMRFHVHACMTFKGFSGPKDYKDYTCSKWWFKPSCWSIPPYKVFMTYR